MNTYAGYSKRTLSNNLALLAGGGEIPLIDIMLHISGTLNVTDETAIQNAQNALTYDTQYAIYIIGDSLGKYPTNCPAVSIPAACVKRLTATIINNSVLNSLVTTSMFSSIGANVGDLIIIARATVTLGELKLLYSIPSYIGNDSTLIEMYTYKIISVNDAKATNFSKDGFSVPEGVMGLESPWDKVQVNKIPGIETDLANKLTVYTNSINAGNGSDVWPLGLFTNVTSGRTNGAVGNWMMLNAGGWDECALLAIDKGNGALYSRIVTGNWGRVLRNLDDLGSLDYGYTVYLNSTGSWNFAHPFSIRNINTTVNTTTILSVGGPDDYLGTAYFGFVYKGLSSPNNFATIGIYNLDYIINATALGRVGIGTTIPTQKLEVNGDVKISGYGTDLYFGEAQLASCGIYDSRLILRGHAGVNVKNSFRVDGSSEFEGPVSILNRLDVSQSVYANGVYASTSGNSGLSLYGNSLDIGIRYATTSSYGKLGAVQSDRAVYFTTTTTSAYPRRGWVFRNITNSTNVASIGATGEAYFPAIGNDNYVVYPIGGHYNGSTSTTGAIQIAFPTVTYKNNCMLKLTVEIYNYVTGTSSTYIIGCYTYLDGKIYQPSAYALRLRVSVLGNLPVRFGRDTSDTRNMVWIGETTTTWSYLKVWIKEISLGYSGAVFLSYSSGWAISAVSSFGTVDSTISNPAVDNYLGTILFTTAAELNGTEGSFFFAESSGLISSGYDTAGILVYSGFDKWQIASVSGLLWRQNDTGGTNTSWGAWKTLLDSSNWSQYITATRNPGTATSLTSLDITKTFIYALISSNMTLGLSADMEVGLEITVLVYNSGSSGVTITVPSAWKTLDAMSIYLINLNFVEISILCYSSLNYMVSYKQQ